MRRTAVLGCTIGVVLAGCVAGGERSRRPAAPRPAQARGPGAPSEPREDPVHAEEESSPGTWTESLDDLVFGDPEPDDWAESRQPSPPAPATSDASAARTGGAVDSGAVDSRATAAPKGASDGESAALGGEPFVSQNPADHARKGATALDAGQFEEAAAHFRVALDLAEPTDRWLYLRVLANLHLVLRREDEALSLYRQLIAEDPERSAKDASVQGNLAVVYYRLGRLPEARRAVDRSLRTLPGAPETVKTLGLIELAAGNAEEAEKLLRRAVGSKPSIPEAQIALAEIEAGRGDLESGLKRYRYLLDHMGQAGFQDPVRRWRDLFAPEAESTEDELRGRIRRLESREPPRSGATAESKARDS